MTPQPQIADTGDTPLTVDEFVIEPATLPGCYVARLALRYLSDQYAAALAVAFTFLEGRYQHVVVSGHNGSINGDQVTVWFWSSGPRLTILPDARQQRLKGRG